LYNLQGGADVDYRQYIVRDPRICDGEAVIKGSRVTVRTIPASSAEGSSIEAVLASFPTLTEVHVQAAIAYARASAHDGPRGKGA
jgi:uncharacterized protein (DUF433 family)